MNRPTMSKVDLVKVNSVSSKPRKYQSVLVLGWGETSVGEYRQVNDLLNEANLRIIPNSMCNNVEGDWNGIHVTYDGYISESMVCASFKNRDSCQGDSGGPLIIKGEDGSSDLLVGLVSWGVGCANDWPGVYARVSSRYNWIRREVCLRSVFPPEQIDCEPF
jgi:trypsin